MIIYDIEMDKFIPLKWELEPFDLKKINDISRNHPYQQTMFLVCNYYCSYDDEVEGDILYEIDYFKLLDRYYRYGITFDNGDLYPENVLCVNEDFDETPPFIYI